MNILTRLGQIHHDFWWKRACHHTVGSPTGSNEIFWSDVHLPSQTARARIYPQGMSAIDFNFRIMLVMIWLWLVLRPRNINLWFTTIANHHHWPSRIAQQLVKTPVPRPGPGWETLNQGYGSWASRWTVRHRYPDGSKDGRWIMLLQAINNHRQLGIGQWWISTVADLCCADWSSQLWPTGIHDHHAD